MDPISAAIVAAQGLWLLVEVVVGATAAPIVTPAEPPAITSTEDEQRKAEEALRDQDPGDYLWIKGPTKTENVPPRPVDSCRCPGLVGNAECYRE